MKKGVQKPKAKKVTQRRTKPDGMHLFICQEAQHYHGGFRPWNMCKIRAFDTKAAAVAAMDVMRNEAPEKYRLLDDGWWLGRGYFLGVVPVLKQFAKIGDEEPLRGNANSAEEVGNVLRLTSVRRGMHETVGLGQEKFIAFKNHDDLLAARGAYLEQFLQERTEPPENAPKTVSVKWDDEMERWYPYTLSSAADTGWEVCIHRKRWYDNDYAKFPIQNADPKYKDNQTW